MKIVFVQAPCIRFRCCVCGGVTEKHEIQALARADDGSEIGFVCEQCIEAGSDGMKERATEAAELAIRDAAKRKSWAAAFRNEAVVCPTMQDWKAAEEQWDREREEAEQADSIAASAALG